MILNIYTCAMTNFEATYSMPSDLIAFLPPSDRKLHPACTQARTLARTKKATPICCGRAHI